jgi:hypothetical protein
MPNENRCREADQAHLMKGAGRGEIDVVICEGDIVWDDDVARDCDSENIVFTIWHLKLSGIRIWRCSPGAASESCSALSRKRR